MLTIFEVSFQYHRKKYTYDEVVDTSVSWTLKVLAHSTINNLKITNTRNGVEL